MVCLGSRGQKGVGVTLPDSSGTCPSPGSRIFVEERDVSFPFSPLHLVDPAGVIIILTTPQVHLIKCKQVAQRLGSPPQGSRAFLPHVVTSVLLRLETCPNLHFPRPPGSVSSQGVGPRSSERCKGDIFSQQGLCLTRGGSPRRRREGRRVGQARAEKM